MALTLDELTERARAMAREALRLHMDTGEGGAEVFPELWRGLGRPNAAEPSRCR